MFHVQTLGTNDGNRKGFHLQQHFNCPGRGKEYIITTLYPLGDFIKKIPLCLSLQFVMNPMLP